MTALALGLTGSLLLVSILLALLLARRSSNARAQAASPTSHAVDPADFGAASLSERATVVQFSTSYCARCPGTRRVLEELVAGEDGVEFLHVDVTDDPALARKYRLTQTPTVLLIDGAGSARTRFSGPASRAVLDEALHELIGETA